VRITGFGRSETPRDREIASRPSGELAAFIDELDSKNITVYAGLGRARSERLRCAHQESGQKVFLLKTLPGYGGKKTSGLYAVGSVQQTHHDAEPLHEVRGHLDAKHPWAS